MHCAAFYMNPNGQAKIHSGYLNASFLASTVYLTVNNILQLKDNIDSDYTGWFITCSARLFRWSHGQQNQSVQSLHFRIQSCSYLFHVSVVHGVVRHLIGLQLDNLFELIAVAFPLADDDHFIKQEYVPTDTYTC